MKYFIDRAKEKSTWAGVAALAILFGVPPELAHVATEAMVAVAGVAAVVWPTTSGK